jgi:hypothetical protein
MSVSAFLSCYLKAVVIGSNPSLGIGKVLKLTNTRSQAITRTCGRSSARMAKLQISRQRGLYALLRHCKALQSFCRTSPPGVIHENTVGRKEGIPGAAFNTSCTPPSLFAAGVEKPTASSECTASLAIAGSDSLVHFDVLQTGECSGVFCSIRQPMMLCQNHQHKAETSIDPGNVRRHASHEAL